MIEEDELCSNRDSDNDSETDLLLTKTKRRKSNLNRFSPRRRRSKSSRRSNSHRHSRSKNRSRGRSNSFLLTPEFNEQVAAMGLFFKSVGAFFMVFFSMAAIGGLMQVLSRSPNKVIARNVEESKEVDWKMALEAGSMAFQATWLAAKLWFRVVMSVLLPTSHHSWMITKDGFSALQPSLRTAALGVVHADPITKVIFIGILGFVVLVFTLQREIKRRRYVERVTIWYDRMASGVHKKYDKVAKEIRRESQIAADLLPHVLYLTSVVTVWCVAPDTVNTYSRGLTGWVVVICWPIAAATRALVIYDGTLQNRLETHLGDTDKKGRAVSALPTRAEVEEKSFFESVLASAQKSVLGSRSSTRSRNESNPRGSTRSVDANASSSNKRPTLQRQDSAEALKDQNPVSAMDQYNDLNNVTFWLYYWTVFSFPLIIERTPIVGHLLKLFPAWPALRVAYSLWLQIPGTRGAELTYRKVVPLVDKYVKKIEQPHSTGQHNIIVNALFAMNLISATTRRKLSDILEAGGTVALVALPFFFMPSFITAVGCVIIGIGWPMYSSLIALLSTSAAYTSLKTPRSKRSSSLKDPLNAISQRVSSETSTVSSGAYMTCQWLEYWVVYTLFMLVHGWLDNVLWWFPLWLQLQLVAILWLQLPYFRGAHSLFKVLLSVYYKTNIRGYFFSEPTSDADNSNVKQVDQEGALPGTDDKDCEESEFQVFDNQDDIDNNDLPSSRKRISTSSRRSSRRSSASSTTSTRRISLKKESDEEQENIETAKSRKGSSRSGSTLVETEIPTANTETTEAETIDNELRDCSNEVANMDQVSEKGKTSPKKKKTFFLF